MRLLGWILEEIEIRVCVDAHGHGTEGLLGVLGEDTLEMEGFGVEGYGGGNGGAGEDGDGFSGCLEEGVGCGVGGD